MFFSSFRRLFGKRQTTHVKHSRTRRRSRACLAVEALEDRTVPAVDLLQLPLVFEANVGQADPAVDFLSRGEGFNIFLTGTEAVLDLYDADAVTRNDATVRLQLLGAGAVEPAAVEQAPGFVNYFIGDDPAGWFTDIPLASTVGYDDIYPGIDLVYYGSTQRQLEYDYIVAPGADPGLIQLGIQGAQDIVLDVDGNLVIHTTAGDIVQQAPIIYQQVSGQQQPVTGGYVLLTDDAGGVTGVGFQIGAYDPSLPLVIDPVVNYATYLGGSLDDDGLDIAVDSSGAAYITGYSRSANFPASPGSFDTSLGGTSDAFVSKFDSVGNRVYTTYLGGSGQENDVAGFVGAGIAVDSSGNAYLTGHTTSTDFPLLGAIEGTLEGGQDAFVTKLNPAGSGLVYSTYLGGTGIDAGDGIALDGTNNAYVTGRTSGSFSIIAGAVQPTFGGGTSDAFVTKINPTGTGPLVFSTYLGGTSTDVGLDVAVDSTNTAYVTGRTLSADYPLAAAADSSFAGGAEGFVTRLNVGATARTFSTFLGGGGDENLETAQSTAIGSIAVDSTGNAYVTGSTTSTAASFPTTAGAFDAGLDGPSDAYVTKLSAAGGVLYTTYLGGSGSDFGLGITVNAAGLAYVTGFTDSTNFPSVTPTQPGGLAGGTGRDAFLTRFNALGTGVGFSTYLGGAGGTVGDLGRGVAVDSLGNAHVVGFSDSLSFPTVNPFQTSNAGAGDAFVAKINNQPPTITSNGGGAVASTAINENTTAVTTVIAGDLDGDTVTFSITGGVDAARFTLVGAALSFTVAPNFEAPNDLGGPPNPDNIYVVTVTASDGLGGTDTQDINVAVLNVNETPTITSNGGGDTASTSIAENTTAVTTVTASDPDVPPNSTFSITGGADQGSFTINSSTGVLAFSSAPNFDAPTDSDTNNVYIVIVQVSDGSLTDSQTINVTVTNVNEAPTINSNGGGATASVNVAENTTAVTTVTATDPDAGAAQIYSLTGGADQARFSINAGTGVLTFLTAPNFEAPTDADLNNIYLVQVTVTDGLGGSDLQDLSVTVTNVVEIATITSNGGGAAAATSVAENTTAVTTVTATGDLPLTFSISGGADQLRFTINSGTGVLTFVTAPNFEAPTDAGANNVYDVQVQASNGAGSDTQDIAVTVTDVNEAPVITSNGGGATAATSVAENTTAVTTVTATDLDAGASVTFSISGGADAARFTINAGTGVLAFAAAPNFEAPTDAGPNNVYDVQVRASDGLGGIDTQDIAVTVTNVNETPTITSNGGGDTASVSVAENTTAVTTVVASDPDVPTTLTYSISGGADSGSFTINSGTGALTFVTAPTFEAPTDTGADNVYVVVVQASDGSLLDSQTINVTVTNVNEAPVITSNGAGATASISVAENTTAVTTVTATDPDAGAAQIYSISGGADQARFSINAASGVLTFLTAPDFEAPTDAGLNNVYDVTVQVSDGLGGTDTQAISVTVINANDAPVITSNGGGATAAVSVAENTTAVTTVTATDQDAGATQTYSISGGSDAARFTINAASGALTFTVAPDFEAPNDTSPGPDNTYVVTVQVSDGLGGADTQTISVAVTNANEAPTITSNGGGATAATSVAENTTAVTTVTASDPDAGPSLTFAITGGSDAARFTINGISGALAFGTAPNFEAPNDTTPGPDNTYVVTVQVSDGLGGTDTQTISVTVTNVNEAPVITSNGGGATAAFSVAENTAVATTVTATDPDAGASFTFSISGADSGDFAINGSTGVLSFSPAPNFEAPADANTDNVYLVTVQVVDGLGGTDTQDLTVTVTNVNEAPTITSNGGGATAAVSHQENDPGAVTTVTATDPDAGASVTFSISISGGADAGDFTINSSTGDLTFSPTPNFESPADANLDNVYVVTVQASDGLGGTDTQTISVTVTNANENPVISSNGGGAAAAISVQENTTAVTTVTATDPDAGTTLTYSIAGGLDQGQFTINSTTGVLTFVAAPDFETPADTGTPPGFPEAGDNVYEVMVEANDGGGGPTAFDTQTLLVTVTNVNEAPTITSDGGGASASFSVAENSTAVTTVTATDPDAGASLIFFISGPDVGDFSINSFSGVLTFSPAPNFEVPTDGDTNNIYLVTVHVDDGLGGFDTQAIDVTVTNVVETATITSNGGGATASVSVAENTTAVTTVTATGDLPITFSISGGVDAAFFSINSTTGVLTFSAADFETPADTGTDNVYDVQVQASGAGTDVQDIAVTVTNVNEPPVITSNGGGATAAVSVAENTTAVTTVTATDPDAGASVTFSITGGADQTRFNIIPTSGALTFVTAPDFEAPADANTDNIYLVTVQASDGLGGTDTQALSVTVTNVNEAPTITSNGGGASAAVSVAENLTAVTTVTATDPDAGATLSFTITGGADGGAFTLNSSTGVLTFTTAPNFEAPTDTGANNTYVVDVQVADGLGGTDTQTITATVTNVNEAPVITTNGGGATASISVAENTTAVTDVDATDPDAGASLTFLLSGGADQTRFTINSATGVLTFVTAPNFEAPTDADPDNVYLVTVRVNDGLGGFDTQDLSVTVTNVNEAPVITSNGGGAAAAISVQENTTAVTTVAATDPDAGASLTFSISGGADALSFSINATSGVLAFLTAPNFDTPGDVGANNVYDVNVQVTDGIGGSDTQTIAVTVTNVNEAPVITSNGGGATAAISVAENTTAVTTVTATDEDVPTTLTFTTSGGADQALFTINTSTGVLTFVSAPNFESPTDADLNNTYLVQVTASDGLGGSDVQDITVTVTNVNEAPAITSNGGGASASVSVAENTTAVTTVTAGDPDAGASLTFTISGGVDALDFTINNTTGALSFSPAPNFEAPADADTNNTYIVDVQVSDGLGGIDTQTITATVTNVNEAPVITSNGGGATASTSVAENTTAVTTVTATDPDASAVLSFAISGGLDQARFTINSTSGALTFLTAPDFETPTDSNLDNIYVVQVQASDGLGGFDTQDLSVTVTNVSEAAVITSNGGGATAAISVGEGTSLVTTVTAPGDVPVAYSISGGADAGDFSISSTSGALTFTPPPNFEAPADADLNNIYLVTVMASNAFGSDTQDLTVTVTNQAPSSATDSDSAYGVGGYAYPNIANGTLVGLTASSTDPVGGTVTYSLFDSAGGRFAISSSSGVVTVANGAAIDSSGGGYLITVRAADSSGLFSDTVFAISVPSRWVVFSGSVPTFYWTAVPNVSFKVWVNDLVTGQNPVLQSPIVSGTSWAASTALVPGRSYRWWLGTSLPFNTATISNWSAPQDFVVPAVVTPPAPSSPAGGGASQTPLFMWGSATGALYYDVWVANLTTGMSPFVRKTDVAAPATSFSFSQGLSPGQNHRWWVRALLNTGHFTAWSSSLDFTVAAMTAPAQTAPANTTTPALTTDRPTFTWGPGTGAAKYDLWVDRLNMNGTVSQPQTLRVTGITALTFTPSSAQALSPGYLYRWWIGSVSTNGLITTYSGERRFTIAALVAPTPTFGTASSAALPGVAGPSGVTSTPTFTWSTTQAGLTTWFDIWVDRVLPTSGSQVIRVLVDSSPTTWTAGTAGSSTTPPGAAIAQNNPAFLAPGRYRWWIRAISANGTGGAWSSIPYYFTVP